MKYNKEIQDALYEALKELLTGNEEYVIWATNKGLEALAKAEGK